MSPHWPIVIAAIILGIITYLYRFSFISAKGKKFAEKIPPQFLMLLAPATFSAIIANNILSHQANPQELKQKIIVAALALPVAYLTKNIIVTLVFGLGLLYVIQNFFSGVG